MKRTREEANDVINDAYATVRHYPRKLVDPEWTVAAMRESVPWKRERVRIPTGAVVDAPRQTVDMGDAGLTYRYAGQVKKPLAWTPSVLRLKEHVEALTQQTFNFAVGNFYTDGKDYIGFHSDDVRDLVPNSIIASVSLGATRDFVFKVKPDFERVVAKKTFTIPLDDGTLVTMEGQTQSYYKHAIPKRLRIKQPRINWTFRKISGKNA